MIKKLSDYTVEDMDKLVNDTIGKVPIMGGKYAKEFKNELHKDRDHNGKVDALEWLYKAQRGIDLVEELNEQIDFVELANYADHLPFIKDKAAFKATMHRIAEEIEHAQKLSEAQKLLEQNKG